MSWNAHVPTGAYLQAHEVNQSRNVVSYRGKSVQRYELKMFVSTYVEKIVVCSPLPLSVSKINSTLTPLAFPKGAGYRVGTLRGTVPDA